LQACIGAREHAGTDTWQGFKLTALCICCAWPQDAVPSPKSRSLSAVAASRGGSVGGEPPSPSGGAPASLLSSTAHAGLADGVTLEPWPAAAAAAAAHVTDGRGAAPCFLSSEDLHAESMAPVVESITRAAAAAAEGEGEGARAGGTALPGVLAAAGGGVTRSVDMGSLGRSSQEQGGAQSLRSRVPTHASGARMWPRCR
jgi:hypothetical protein